MADAGDVAAKGFYKDSCAGSDSSSIAPDFDMLVVKGGAFRTVESSF